MSQETWVTSSLNYIIEVNKAWHKKRVSHRSTLQQTHWNINTLVLFCIVQGFPMFNATLHPSTVLSHQKSINFMKFWTIVMKVIKQSCVIHYTHKVLIFYTNIIYTYNQYTKQLSTSKSLLITIQCWTIGVRCWVAVGVSGICLIV